MILVATELHQSD